MSMPKLWDAGRPDGEFCPACGAPLVRLHRHFLDRWISLFSSVHRYHCSGANCEWEGLLGREAGPPRVRAIVLWAALLAGFVLGVVTTLASVQGTHLTAKPQPAAPPVAAAPMTLEAESMATPAGQDFDGAPLRSGDPRAPINATPLHLRVTCAWGVPGRNPYRGTVEQALTAALVPSEVVKDIATQVAHGTRNQVQITREGIRTPDHKHYFGKSIRAMAFGNTLCFDTRVNFDPGHVEYASLYEAADKNGKVYSVMVPFVCGNVSLLQERTQPPDLALPTPGTAALALLALGLVAATTAVARRRHRPGR